MKSVRRKNVNPATVGLIVIVGISILLCMFKKEQVVTYKRPDIVCDKELGTNVFMIINGLMYIPSGKEKKELIDLLTKSGPKRSYQKRGFWQRLMQWLGVEPEEEYLDLVMVAIPIPKRKGCFYFYYCTSAGELLNASIDNKKAYKFKKLIKEIVEKAYLRYEKSKSQKVKN